MALRYAVANGNWSSTSTWNGGTLPTSADDVYANGFTVAIDQDVTVLSIRNTVGAPAVVGGTFTCGAGRIINVTSAGIICGNTTVITFTHSTGTSTINGIVNGSTTIATTNAVVHSSTGTLVIVGDILATSTGNNNANGVNVSGGGTLNVTGNVYARGTIKNTITLSAGSTLNLTGNVICENSTANSGIGVSAANATINVTGDLIFRNFGASTNTGWYCIYANNTCTVNVTGQIVWDSGVNSATGGNPVFITGTAGYFNHVGAVTAGRNHSAVSCSILTAINIFSGPFICSGNGINPLYVARIHYRKTIGSYFEFRDSSTNGAVPPAADAPSTRLVSPDTIVDAPIPANVRYGTVYALSSLTGTLRVPSPASVAKDVPTDNTVGTAALTPESVWNVLTSGLTTSGSIGERLKNASTVDTTGAQIATI